jgi:WD40 repeat protein
LQGIAESAFSFHPRQPQLIAGKPRGAFEVWDLAGLTQVNQFSLPRTAHHARFSPDGGRFSAAYPQGQTWVVSVHDATNGALLASHAFDNRMAQFAWHPSGRWLAVPLQTGAILFMDAKTGAARPIGKHRSEVVNAVFSPDGKYLFSGGWDEELICWDAETLQLAFTISLRSFRLELSGDGNQCAVLAASGVRVCHFDRPANYRGFSEVSGVQFRHAAFSPGNRWLAAADGKGLVLWDLTANAPGAVSEAGYDGRPYFSPDGQELYLSRISADGSAAMRWRITPAAAPNRPPAMEQLPLHQPAGFSSLCLLSNSVLITGAKGSRMLAPEQIAEGPDSWLATESGVNEVSPDGRWLGIFAPFNSVLNVYRLPGMGPAARLTERANILDFAFSPGGDEVAVCSRAGIEFWSTTSWQRTRAVPNFLYFLYTPDGGSGWMSKRLHDSGLYDARTFQPLLLLPSDIFPVAVSGDGRYLAVSAKSGHLQVLDLTSMREEFRKLGLNWAGQLLGPKSTLD